MPLLPVALYGLEVPAGDLLVPAVPDFPATFRITMAAIDPTVPAEINEANPSATPRATLKLIRQPIAPSDDENDEYMRTLLGGGSDSEEDSDDEESDEEVNGGPSDPAKSKKAQKAAAVKQLLEAMNADSDEEMEDAVNNGLSAKAKGKAPATEDEDDDDSEDSEDLEIEEFVICTLDPERTYQQTLDITIAEDERVFFKVTGSHTIYLTGNYVIPDDNGHNHHHEVYDSDEESEEDEDYDLSPSEDELELDLEGEESDELDSLDDPRITELDDDEEEVPKLVSKAEKKGKNKRSAAALEDGESLDDMVSKSMKMEGSEETPKLSKKQLKKLKNNKGDAVETKVEENKESAKGDKKVQFAKNLEQGPTGSTPEKAAANGKPKAALGVKEVNGVKIDDKKLGTGKAAKSGNKVEMRYIGKLNDGKVFDSNKKGKPFSFKLGAGEVIKGWDIGIAGMQVGGERRLVIPPQLAYGSQGVAGIPKNATLTFDVKLLSIK